MTARTFAIGDIHGGLKALEQLISRIAPQPDDRFIFMGDYVDGWSESAQTIDYLINLAEAYTCIFLRGNHDTWCEQWLAGNAADPTWLFHGGVSTQSSYQNITDERKQQHLEFFNRMQHYYVDEQNRLFIHAGFSSMHGPAHEHYTTNYSWDRTLWEMALGLNKKMKQDSVHYPKRLRLFHEIYIGHTPTLYYNRDTPMQAGNVWNVDTGAAFYGKLSALNIDSKEYLQSDIVQQLYPNEKGRNKS